MSRIPIENISYFDIEAQGLEQIVAPYARETFIGTVCHKGMRRSRAAALVLEAAAIPVANNGSIPSLCYSDFFHRRNFVVSELGLSVPGKTSFPFGAMILFCDDSKEEIRQVKKVREVLDVEALGILKIIWLAHVMDRESLLGIA